MRLEVAPQEVLIAALPWIALCNDMAGEGKDQQDIVGEGRDRHDGDYEQPPWPQRLKVSLAHNGDWRLDTSNIWIRWFDGTLAETLADASGVMRRMPVVTQIIIAWRKLKEPQSQTAQNSERHEQNLAEKQSDEFFCSDLGMSCSRTIVLSERGSKLSMGIGAD